MNGPRSPRVLLVVLLLAFALRAYHLDFQSLWSDEGISLLRSAQPLGSMLRTMPVEHMPGYFVLLHGWLALAGDSDFALRYLSLLPSVLAVALVFRLGSDLGSRTAGLVAAALLSTSAFQVWYAQEARMYSWLLACGLLSTWLLWRLLNGDPLRWPAMAGYALSVAMGVYLHFYGVLVPLAHVPLALGLAWRRRDWPRLRAWLLAAAAALVLFLPWLPRALGIAGFAGWREPASPWQIPWRYLVAYTVGDAMPQPLHAWLPWLYLGLALLGALAWWRRRPLSALVLVAVTLVPLGAVLALALRDPDFHERYSIAISGPLLLLAAAPFSWQGRDGPRSRVWLSRVRLPLAGLALLGLLGSNSLALARHYGDSTLHKPDFRAAAQAIQAHQRPGDVILVDGPDPQKVFLHYYDGGLPVHDLRSLEGAGGEMVDTTLGEATRGAARAWEVLFFHPPGPVQTWLALRGWASPPSAFNDVRVTLYGLPSGPLDARDPELDVGAGLRLARAEIEAGPARPGDLLRVTTRWQVAAPLPDYKFSLRLWDTAGQVWAADDYVPQNWFAPTSTWAVGLPAFDQRGILLPDDLPPGRYQVTIRLYHTASGVPVQTELGHDILVGQVEVVG